MRSSGRIAPSRSPTPGASPLPESRPTSSDAAGRPRSRRLSSLSRLSVAAARAGMFSALVRYPTYRRLWFGSLGASLGQWMQQVGIGWLAYSLTDSEMVLGLVGLMAGLPFLVVSIPGGLLIDRADRRWLMLACQAAAALLAVAVAVDVIGGWVRPWHLLAAAFLNGSLQAILTPTQQSLVPSLVERADLTNAIGLNSAGQNMTRVVGPSLAGGMIGLFGVGSAFLLQAAALCGAFALVSGISVPPRRPNQAVPGPRSVFDGIRLIAGRPDLRGLFLLACVPTFFVFPYVQFLSVFARDILRIGPSGLGLLMAASGSGAVVGSLMTAARRHVSGAGRTLIWMTIAYGAVIVGIAASRSIYLSLPLLVCAGILGASYMSTNNALLQHRITDDVRGRVMGAYMLTFGLMPLGAMPMGLFANYVGTPIAVATGAVVSSALAAWVGFSSAALREL